MNLESKHNWLLILQGWAILWVVIGNTYLDPAGSGAGWESALLRTAYSFHLPLLMFVFGCIFTKTFLLSDDNLQQKIKMLKKHLLGLIIPFTLFTLVAIAVKAILSISALSLHEIVNDIIQGFLFPGEHPISPLWFIMVLVWLYLLMPIWKYLLENTWIAWSTLVVLLAIHLVNVPIEFLCIKWLCYFAFYFYFGIIIMKKGYLNQLSGLNGFYIFVVGYLLYLLGVDTDKTIAEIGGILFSIGIALILNNSFPKTFLSFRPYYYQIFLMGYFVQLAFRMIYPYLPLPYFIGYLVCLVLGIYVPVMIARIVHSLNYATVNYCIGLNGQTEQEVVCNNNNKLAVEI